MDERARRAQDAVSWVESARPIGRSITEVQTSAARSGVEVRVVSQDGTPLASRADRRHNRVNVEIVDNLVTSIDGIY